MINNLALSPNTQYAAYLVFKMIDADGFRNLRVGLFVGIEGCLGNTKIVCLDPNMVPKLYSIDRSWYWVLRVLDDIVVGLQRPNVRSDGWLEIEMGDFFNLDLQVEEVYEYCRYKGW
ncbi:putative phloem protein [Medicago truncatula]|nr:putative phloem protein [Medicago truncatula]